MQTPNRQTLGWIALSLALLVYAISTASAEDAKTAYPSMAPLAQYLMATPAEEVALARSAAPASIADDAEVLTLTSRGYETAVKGKNGFTCLVQRGWAASFDDTVFWNPRNRSPLCLNPAAVRSVLPAYVERTQWVLAGYSAADMIARTQAALKAKTFVLPEAGSMSYMMSKQGHLNDAAGHWHPHVMFWVANTDEAGWGANLRDSPVFAARVTPEPITIFFIPVKKWSDGTLDEAEKH